LGFAARLRSLASDAAIYGISNVAARFLTFLLVPLYTNVLAPDAYGPIGTLYSWIAFLNVIYGFGLETAYLRFAAPDQGRDERAVFSTPTVYLGGGAALLSTLLYTFAEPIAQAAGLAGHGAYVRAAAFILFLDVLAVLPLAHLRLQRKPRAYAAVRVTSILVNVGLTIWLLVGRGHGPIGILEANLASSAVTVILLIPIYERLLRPRIERPLLSELLRFGLPLVPSGLAAVIVQVADRPILQLLTDDWTVGVYQANYKLGILMMLFVTVFQYAWQPFFLTRAGDPDARPLFARVLTYYLTAALAVFLLVSLLVDRIVAIPIGGGRTLIDARYHEGMAIVPWVLLGYVALGVYTNLTAGPTLEKRTRLFPLVTGAAAIVNIGFNLAFVPRYGMIAAGWSTTLAYLVMAAGMYAVTHRVYRVPYEWRRLALVSAVSLSVWWAFRVGGGWELGLAWRAALLLAYPALLFATGFFERDELRALGRLLTRSAR